MVSKVLSALIAIFLVISDASFLVKADVSGTFNARIEISPVACGTLPMVTITGVSPPPILCENTLPKVDIETSLMVNWTISGLTLGINTVAGFTGIEDLLTSLKATLGAISILDQFFFAVPFGIDTLIITNANQTQTDTETAWTVIAPGNLLFVKKRVSLNISIFGITLTNLAEFADFTFPQFVGPSPCAESFGGKCPDLPKQSDYPSGYSAASQTFAFGDALTISGQTVSGITVTNTTGINLNPDLYEGFKKISFEGVLCKGVDETIAVVGIPIVSGIAVDEALTFDLVAAGLIGPASLPPCGTTPFTAQTVLTVTTGLGTLTADFVTSLPSVSIFDGAELTFSTGPLSLTQEFDATLAALDTQATLNFLLNPDSNPAALTVTATVCQKAGVGFFSGFSCTSSGLSQISSELSVQRSNLTLSVFSALTGSGTVTLSDLEFVVNATAGLVNLDADITIFPTWKGVFTFGVNV